MPQISIDKIKNTELQKGSDTTNAAGDVTVTFPNAFAVAPLVFLQGVDAGSKGIVLDVVSKSTTQVVVKARQVTGITSGTEPVHSHSFSDGFTVSAVSAGTPSGTVTNHRHSFSDGFTVSSESAGTPSGTVSNHRHSFSDSFNTAYVSAGTPSGSINSVSAGTPSGTVSSHNHTNPNTSSPSSTLSMVYSVQAGSNCASGQCYTGVTKTNVASNTHLHPQGTTGNRTPTFSGSAMGTHNHTFSGSAMGTHRHSGSVSGNTGYITPTFTGSALANHNHTGTASGDTGYYQPTFTGGALATHQHTGTASGTTGDAGAHSHSVDAPALAIDFDWLAVKV